MTAGQEPLVSVENLSVEFHTDAGVVKAVDGVSWSISPGGASFAINPPPTRTWLLMPRLFVLKTKI